MKQIWGLVIADPNEIHNFELNFINKTKHKETVFFHYQWNDVEVIAVESGIGIVNAAMMTQKIIDIFKATKILNYGAVGASKKLKLFDIVIPKRFYFHDVETPWYPRSQTPGEIVYYLNSFKKTSELNIASGNSFIYKKEHLKSIKKDLPVDLFDMESSAIAQVCYKNNVSFFCVKSVSDIINFTNNDNKNINQNISISSKNAFNELISMFNLILLD